jgi:hypothetical protein
VQWLSAFEQYASKAGNVAPETTEGLVQGFAGKLAAYKATGEYAPEFTSLARFAGIGDVRQLSVDQLIDKLSSVVGKEGNNGPLAQYLATQFGFGPLGNVLAKGQGAYRQGIQEHLSTSVTPEQTEELQRLQGAVNDVNSAWDGLVRSVVTDNPEWIKFLESWHGWLVNLQSTPDGLHAVETAAKAVSGVLGLVMVAAISTLVAAVVKANATLLATPLGRLLLLGIAVADAFDDKKNKANYNRYLKDQQDADDYEKHIEEYQTYTKEGFLSKTKHRFTGYASDPAFQAWMKEKGYSIPRDIGDDAKDALGGVKSFVKTLTKPFGAPAASAGGTPDKGDILSGLRRSALRYGLNPDDVQKVAEAEGFNAKDYATWDVNNYSYGALQMHRGGLADEFQKATGLDPADPKNAVAMNDWAVAYAAKNGWGKWTSVSQGRVATPRPFDAAAQDLGGGQFNSDLRALQSGVQEQQAISSAAQGGNISTTGGSSVNNDVDIGAVHVHAPSNDPAAMGDAVRGYMQSNLRVSGANTGLA